MTRHLSPARVALALALGLTAPVGTPAAAQDDHDHEAHEEGEGHDAHEESHEVPGAEDARAGDGHEEEGSDDHLVRLTAAEITELGLELRDAGPGVIASEVELPGEVRPNADRLAHIVPRYSGIVTEVRANIGDRVEKGQVLAIIESNESLAPFEVQTLMSGTVIGKHIALGEAAARDRDAFVIADLSSVWIDLTVYQRDLDRVRVGQRVQLLIGHEPVRTGTIDYITPVVDVRTRTATARVVLSNERGIWRPGMFVTARVLVDEAEVPVAVPRTALHVFDGHTVVFVETAGGFRPQPVTIGRRGDARVEVVEGLDAGQRYVSEGGFTLKAELGKDDFGGHGHAH